MPTASLQVKASIERPASTENSNLESWQVEDELSLTSRGFTVETTAVGQMQVGNDILISGGYDSNRVTLMHGRIDNVVQRVEPGKQVYTTSGRDHGMKELGDADITFAWYAHFESPAPGSTGFTRSVTPMAHDILRQAAAFVGVDVASLAFPDYPLYNSFVVHRRPLLEVVQQLLEPWNLFARIQYVPVVRDKVLSVIKIDWEHPPSTGYVIPWSRVGMLTRTQRDYSEKPRLTEVGNILIRGAAYTRQRIVIGTETRYTYNSPKIDASTLAQIAGTFNDFVWVEVVTLEQLQDGKVIHTEESHYQGSMSDGGAFEAGELVKRITVDNSYFLPFSATQKLQSFDLPSLTNALLKIAVEVIEEPVEYQISNATVDDFLPVERVVKQYFYDDNNQKTAEIMSTQEIDLGTHTNNDTSVSTNLGWLPARVEVRTDTQVTSNSVRTQLTSYTVDPANNNKLSRETNASQLVGGKLIIPNGALTRNETVSVQEQYPPPPLRNGVPIEKPSNGNEWVYENNYLGPNEVQTIYNLALDERKFQATSARWETIDLELTLDPNIWAGQFLHAEVATDTFVDYWVESVRHHFDPNSARTSAVCRRLTDSGLSDVLITVPAVPSNLIATVIDNTEVDLTWTDNSTDEDGFIIERSLDNSFWTQIATVGANVTSYSDTGLTASTLYYYRVRSFKN